MGFPLAFVTILAIEHVIDKLGEEDEDVHDDKSSISGVDSNGYALVVRGSSNKHVKWEEDAVLNSYHAMVGQPEHKEHIQSHIEEMLASVIAMEQRANKVILQVIHILLKLNDIIVIINNLYTFKFYLVGGRIESS